METHLLVIAEVQSLLRQRFGGAFARRSRMNQSVPDRRRIPRAVIADAELSVLSVLTFPVAVRVRDISLSGVLVEATHPIGPGMLGTLRFTFGGVPFSADVKVERLSPEQTAAGRQSYNIGATFVSLSRQDQRVIERFADQ